MDAMDEMSTLFFFWNVVGPFESFGNCFAFKVLVYILGPLEHNAPEEEGGEKAHQDRGGGSKQDFFCGLKLYFFHDLG